MSIFPILPSPRPRVAASPRLLLALLLSQSACTADTATSAPASKPAPAKVVVENAPYAVPFDTTPIVIKGKTFSIEVALTEAQEQRGLMYRDSLPEDHGMLFVMPYEDNWSFWMHQTRIPLDIVYLDKNGKVLEIHAREPFDEAGRGPAEKALYVIELNLNTAHNLGLKRGDIIEIPRKYVKT